MYPVQRRSHASPHRSYFTQIATTNAIVAGLQILQAFHILRAQLEGKTVQDDADADDDLVAQCRYINCVRQPSRNGLLLIASTLEPPNPNCYVCRSATLHVQLNLPNWTLRDFLDKVLKAELGFVEPALFLEGNGIYEEDEDDFVPNLTKKLEDLPCGGIRHGTVLLVEDYSQDLSVEIVVAHCDAFPTGIKKGGDDDDELDDAAEPDPFKFVVGGSKPAVAAPPAAAAAAASSDPEINGDNGGRNQPTVDRDDDDDDVVEIMDDAGSDKKRASTEDPTPPHPKKRKGMDSSDVIELD
jgi:ubiquitin-like 1-activating enzyme E1 B